MQINGRRPHVPVTDTVLLAVALRMDIDPNETDWMEIDPFEVVIACVSRNRRDDFDWTHFEQARVKQVNHKFPNRYVFPPSENSPKDGPLTPDI